MSLGEQIKNLREKEGLTLQQFTNQVNRSINSKWDRVFLFVFKAETFDLIEKDIVKPSFFVLNVIADFYNIKLKDLNDTSRNK